MTKILDSFTRCIGRLRRDRRGNVLMIFGFALIPLVFATGMGVDYAAAMRLKTKVDAAADAGALAATTTPMLNQTMAQACTAATNMFVQQSSNLRGLTLNTAQLSGLTITMTETYSAAGSQPVTLTCGTLAVTLLSATGVTPVSRTATITYHGTSANSFANVLGMATLPVEGTTTARVGLGTYYQIVFAVDVSNSMGIGGTAADITSLSTDPQVSCAFACHDPNHTGSTPTTASGWCEANPTDYFCRHSAGQAADNKTYCPYGAGACGTVYPSVTYADRRNLAKAFGYKLKIDYVNNAVSSFISSLQSPMTNAPNNYAVSVYTFGTGATFGAGAYSPIQPTTTNWATLNATAGHIDLETAAYAPTGYGNQGWTYTTAALQNIGASLTNVGDGSTPTSRKTYVIFISDGVEDVFSASNGLIYNRTTNYNYSQQCQALKNNGITMFSIEASYPVINNDGQYDILVGQLPSRNNGTQIADVMKGCASSPDKYYLASDGPGIQNAVNSVFSAIIEQASRLTH